MSPNDFPSGQGVDPMGELTLSAVNITQLPISPPETMMRSTRIKRSCFVPSGSEVKGNVDTPVKQLLGIQRSELYLHDIATNKNIAHESVSVSHTYVCLSNRFPNYKSLETIF